MIQCPGGIRCPVETTLNLIGGKYKALIVYHLMDTTLHYSQLSRGIPSATPKMLTQQLQELEEDGFIRRTVYPVVPPKVEYTLTELGNSVLPVISAMVVWGRDYLQRAGISCP